MLFNRTYLYPVLLFALIIASFFHMQGVVMGMVILIVIMQMVGHFPVVKLIRLFAVLLIPVVLGLISGYLNDNYLIVKDFYYLSVPVLFVLCGILLASSMEIPQFLKIIVYAGGLTSFLVTTISVSYVGLQALTDPYSAHYAIGIVGTPLPPVALGCLLLTRKFNIKLFTPKWFNILTAINCLGVYMFASRTYLIITICFLLLLVANRVKRKWLIPMTIMGVAIFILLPFDSFRFDSSSTFLNKIMGSFSEVSIGNYNTEQDINTRYRGYESFMAIQGYTHGTTKELIFGGLGKLIDLKTFVRLGEDSYFRYIPVLHNGWLYVLVKTGIAGILAYAAVFISLIVINWRVYANDEARPIFRLFAAIIIGCVLSLLFTNYIVSAFFNVEMSVLMITLGFSYYNFYYLLNTFKEQKETVHFEFINTNELNYTA